MPTIITHPAVPIAIALAVGRNLATVWLLACGILASVAPDFDVALHRIGIPYASEFGHRGASHSVLFSAGLACLLAFVYAKAAGKRFMWAFVFIFIAGLSHPLLDMCTDGGLGVALFWPLSDQRYFADFRPITVSPLSLSRFFGPAGVAVLRSELIWVWLPAVTFGFCGFFYRHGRKTA